MEVVNDGSKKFTEEWKSYLELFLSEMETFV